jgi:hypothetical protein
MYHQDLSGPPNVYEDSDRSADEALSGTPEQTLAGMNLYDLPLEHSSKRMIQLNTDEHKVSRGYQPVTTDNPSLFERYSLRTHAEVVAR